MTPKAEAALFWFDQNGPIGWFDRTAPSDAMRRSLLRRGLIERLPTAQMQLVKYQITDAGRTALQQREDRKP